MIGYVILGLCVLAALIIAGRMFVNADPKVLAKFLRYIIFGVIGAAAIFFMVTGRFLLGAPLAALALGMLRRWSLPNWKFSFPGGGSGRSAKSSTVETAFLRMKLEHGSGVMSGEVLRGIFSGMELAAMSQNQLLALLEECDLEDPESAQLLSAYLDRIFGEDWRSEDAGADAGASEAGGRRRSGWGSRGGAARGGAMSLAEACEVLGVRPGADADEIKEAHRRLILKNHPDQGGSSFLAAKINQAKEVLLDQ